MKEFNYTITDPEGIHMRPAGELVKAAKQFESRITTVSYTHLIRKWYKCMLCTGFYTGSMVSSRQRQPYECP